jgi:hypothetical protein
MDKFVKKTISKNNYQYGKGITYNFPYIGQNICKLLKHKYLITHSRNRENVNIRISFVLILIKLNS